MPGIRRSPRIMSIASFAVPIALRSWLDMFIVTRGLLSSNCSKPQRVSSSASMTLRVLPRATSILPTEWLIAAMNSPPLERRPRNRKTRRFVPFFLPRGKSAPLNSEIFSSTRFAAMAFFITWCGILWEPCLMPVADSCHSRRFPGYSARDHVPPPAPRLPHAACF